MIKLNTQQRKERKTMKNLYAAYVDMFMKEQQKNWSRPICKIEKFIEQGEDLTWAAEHVVGVASDVSEDIKRPESQFRGRVLRGWYVLAMSRVAFREDIRK